MIDVQAGIPAADDHADKAVMQIGAFLVTPWWGAEHGRSVRG
ncbi:MAG TPA: hypothetical protein VF482_11190 [Trebonia sp.]